MYLNLFDKAVQRAAMKEIPNSNQADSTFYNLKPENKEKENCHYHAHLPKAWPQELTLVDQMVTVLALAS